jgi:hypothetical protein
MSSAAIVSAGLTTLTLLCCHCRLRCRFVVVFAVSSSLSSSPFGIIVTTITAVVSVAPAAVILATFVVALAVFDTTFLAVEVALVVDCCVPLLMQHINTDFCHGVSTMCPSVT